MRTITGTRTWSPDWLNSPIGVVLHGDELFIAQEGRERLVIFHSQTGQFLRQWDKPGLGGTRGDDSIHFGRYAALRICDDELYFNDGHQEVIKVFNLKNGNLLRILGEGQLNDPTGLAVTSTCVYVSDYGNNSVVVLDRERGRLLHRWPEIPLEGSDDGQFNSPYGLELLENDRDNTELIVADLANNRLQSFR